MAVFNPYMLANKSIPSMGLGTAPNVPMATPTPANFGLGASTPTPTPMSVSSAAMGAANPANIRAGAPAFNGATPGAASVYPAKGNTPQGAIPPTNWGQFLGDGTETGGARSTNGTDPGWQQSLSWVKQFDPSAEIRSTMMPDGTYGQYIAFDNSKLPTNAMGGHGILNAANVPALADSNHYIGPMAHDANLGDIGNSRFAARTLTDRGGLADVLGPLLVGGLTLGAGALGGFGTGLFNTMNSGFNAIRGFANGQGINPMTVAGGALRYFNPFGG